MSQATWQWSFGKFLASLLRRDALAPSAAEHERECWARRQGGCTCEHLAREHELMFAASDILVRIGVRCPGKATYTPPSADHSQRPLKVVRARLAPFDPTEYDAREHSRVERWLGILAEIKEKLDLCIEVATPALEAQCGMRGNVPAGADKDALLHASLSSMDSESSGGSGSGMSTARAAA